MDRRTMRGWFEHLDDSKREVTLSEFMAMMIMHEREYARRSLDLLCEIAEASAHTEGMLGAIDAAAALVAERSGLPYAASGEIRAAMDAARDETRRLAAVALREAQHDGVPARTD